MDKKLWLAGLSFACALSLSACGEVDNCKEGSEGCFGGPCDEDNECKFSLVCVSDLEGNPVCGERRGDGFECGPAGECSDEMGQDGDQDGSDPEQCNCEDGELCLPGEPDDCIATFCETSDLTPGSKRGLVPGTCTPMDNEAVSGLEPLTFEEACVTRCLQNCALVRAFCPGATCDVNACSAAAEQVSCMTDCAAAVTPDEQLTCITDDCVAVSQQQCEDFVCPNGSTPVCDNITCNDSCAFSNDTECDDGDIESAQSVGCSFGTDCSDCGPRAHTQNPPLVGDLCLVDWHCADYDFDPADNAVWCVEIESSGVERCVPNCSESGVCPEGYTCDAIEADDPDIQDLMEYRACLPAICE